jgi:hypothetical protein
MAQTYGSPDTGTIPFSAGFLHPREARKRYNGMPMRFSKTRMGERALLIQYLRRPVCS